MAKKKSKRRNARNRTKRQSRRAQGGQQKYAVEFVDLEETAEEQERIGTEETAAGELSSGEYPQEESEQQALPEIKLIEPEDLFGPEGEEACESKGEEASGPEGKEACGQEGEEASEYEEAADTRADAGIPPGTAMEERVITGLPRAPFDWRRLAKRAFAAVGVCCAVYLILLVCCVKPEVTIEVGESCPGIDAFLNLPAPAHFAAETDTGVVFEEPGDYGVVIVAYGKKHAAVIHVRDTTAPEFETIDITCYNGQRAEPEAFVAEVWDLTEVTFSFQEEPDFSSEGTREVTIFAEDAGGNRSAAKADLTVIFDTEAPVIEGVEELTIFAGESVSYKKGVTVTDNRDKQVSLEVDASGVDTNQTGDYTVTYIAVDSAGNETTVETTLHVQQPTVETVTAEIVNELADQLLAAILTDDMSQYEIAKTIYWWCHDNIAYSDGTPKISPEAGAFQGLAYRKGDCYTYAMTAKFLLTRAGIKNMDIERIPSGNSMHYWNLIDIGEGWYHFDTCRRADGSTFFYKTDEEIKRYSDANNGTHNYDRSLYPKIN